MRREVGALDAQVRVEPDQAEGGVIGDLSDFVGESIGSVIFQKHFQLPAPSILAASYSGVGMDCRPLK